MHLAEMLERTPFVPITKAVPSHTGLIRFDGNQAVTLTDWTRPYLGATNKVERASNTISIGVNCSANTTPSSNFPMSGFQSFDRIKFKCRVPADRELRDYSFGQNTVLFTTYAPTPVDWSGISWSGYFTPPDDQQWQTVSTEIDSIEMLEPDWDGDDGIVPTADMIRNLRAVLATLKGQTAPAPSEVFVVGDGEIGFRWRTHDTFASASFLPDGSFLASVRSPRLQRRFSMDAVWESRPSLRPFVSALLQR